MKPQPVRNYAFPYIPEQHLPDNLAKACVAWDKAGKSIDGVSNFIVVDRKGELEKCYNRVCHAQLNRISLSAPLDVVLTEVPIRRAVKRWKEERFFNVSEDLYRPYVEWMLTEHPGREWLIGSPSIAQVMDENRIAVSAHIPSQGVAHWCILARMMWEVPPPCFEKFNELRVLFGGNLAYAFTICTSLSMSDYKDASFMYGVSGHRTFCTPKTIRQLNNWLTGTWNPEYFRLNSKPYSVRRDYSGVSKMCGAENLWGSGFLFTDSAHDIPGYSKALLRYKGMEEHEDIHIPNPFERLPYFAEQDAKRNEKGLTYADLRDFALPFLVNSGLLRHQAEEPVQVG